VSLAAKSSTQQEAATKASGGGSTAVADQLCSERSEGMGGSKLFSLLGQNFFSKSALFHSPIIVCLLARGGA
jgi:hypothetical protein